MRIRTFFSLPLDAALDGIPTEHTKVRATAGGEDRSFWWALWNTGISSFCQHFQQKARESLDRSVSPSLPLIEHSAPQSPTPPLTCILPINSRHLYTLLNSRFCQRGSFRPNMHHNQAQSSFMLFLHLIFALILSCILYYLTFVNLFKALCGPLNH